MTAHAPLSTPLPEPGPIAALRAAVRRIEGREHRLAGTDDGSAPLWRFGIDTIDEAAGGGLAPGLHLFSAGVGGDGVTAPALALALAAAEGSRGRLLWVTTRLHAREWGRPHPDGLHRLGLDPARLLAVEADRPAEAAWAIEEALRARAFDAVVSAGVDLDFKGSRRLALAAASHGCALFVTMGAADPGPLAAATQWRATPAPSPPDPYDPRAPGGPAWRLELTRSRSLVGGSWEVAWDEAAHRFALAPAPAARPAPARARGHGAAEPLRAGGGRAARA